MRIPKFVSFFFIMSQSFFSYADFKTQEDDVPVISKHNIKEDSVRDWKGILWSDGTLIRTGFEFNISLRLNNPKKIDKAPEGIVTFTLFQKKREEKVKIRQFSLTPKWSKIGIKGGYQEIEYDQDGTTVKRESKKNEKYNGSPGSWEMFFIDPIQTNYKIGSVLTPGNYLVEVEVNLKDGSVLSFKNVAFVVFNKKP